MRLLRRLKLCSKFIIPTVAWLCDGSISYKGTDYSIYILSDFYTQFNHSNHTNIDDGSSIYVWPDDIPQSATTLGQLPTWETGSGDRYKVNGTYVWRDSAFHHQ